MSKASFIFGLTITLSLVSWLTVRPGPPVAQAAQSVQYDAFSEDEAAHRYATSQPRHWRHLLIKK